MGVKSLVSEWWKVERSRLLMRKNKHKELKLEPKHKKVTVTGYIEQEKLIKWLRHKTGKKIEPWPWPYIPYGVVPHPYTPPAYDKKAPPGYVKIVLDDPHAAPLVRANSLEEKYPTAFSDEHPSALM